MKPFWVYMLRCSDGSYYVGHTDDLERRVTEHQSGAIAGYTSQRRPVVLVYAADMVTRDEAIASEVRIKGWTRAKKEALIQGSWSRLKELARGPDRIHLKDAGEGAQGSPPFDSAPFRPALSVAKRSRRALRSGQAGTEGDR